MSLSITVSLWQGMGRVGLGAQLTRFGKWVSRSPPRFHSEARTGTMINICFLLKVLKVTFSHF